MDRDDLDERLRLAGQPDAAVVGRVVDAVLSGGGSGPVRRRSASATFAALALTLVALVVAGAWWTHRMATPPGVYRIDALPAPSVDAVSLPAGDGVYRVEAQRTPADSRVIRVTASDGTTWILSATPNENWLPPGSTLVIGGGEAK